MEVAGRNLLQPSRTKQPHIGPQMAIDDSLRIPGSVNQIRGSWLSQLVWKLCITTLAFMHNILEHRERESTSTFQKREIYIYYSNTVTTGRNVLMFPIAQ